MWGNRLHRVRAHAMAWGLVVITAFGACSAAWGDVLLAHSDSIKLDVYTDSGTLDEVVSLAGTYPHDAFRIGPDGAVYMNDRGGYVGVVRYDPLTRTSTPFTKGPPMTKNLLGIDFGPDGNLYASGWDSMSSWVFKFDGKTGDFLSEFLPSGTTGLSRPMGLDFAPDGDLYVAMQGTNSVAVYDGVTGQVKRAGSGLPGGLREIQFGPDKFLYKLRTDSLGHGAVEGRGFLFEGVKDATGFDFGPDGAMYIADNLERSIRVHDLATGAFRSYFVQPGSLTGTSAGLMYLPDPAPPEVVPLPSTVLMGLVLLAGVGVRNGIRRWSAASAP